MKGSSRKPAEDASAVTSGACGGIWNLVWVWALRGVPALHLCRL